jgi:hypothetical protein
MAAPLHHRALSAILLALLAARAAAQERTPRVDTTAAGPQQAASGASRPDPGMAGTTLLGLSFSQSSSSNWYGMPDATDLAVGMSIVSTPRFTLGPLQLRTSLSLRLGLVYHDDTTGRPPLGVTDNEASGEEMIVYRLGWLADPYISASARTAITESFMQQIHGVPPLRIAKLWDPVTSQQAIGFTYSAWFPTGYYSARVGVSLMQIRAHDHPYLSDDPMTYGAIERYRARSGIEVVNEGSVAADSSITCTGRLALLGSFQQPEVWSARFEGEIRARVWRFIGVTLALNVLHDITQTRRTQFRQSLTLGVMQSM